MRRRGFVQSPASALVAVLTAVFVAALATAPDAAERRYVSDDEAARWAGVGLLTRADGGACTGVLVRPDVVLTAAHCVADADAKTVQAAGDLMFRAGVRDGASLGGSGVRAVQVHPGYFVASADYDERRIRVDVARVVLADPIREAPSYAIGATPPAGSEVALLSYPSSRRDRASIQAPCGILDRETEFLLLDCLTEPGSSGAPYFGTGPGGEPVVVGIHSGGRERGNARYALALAFAHVRDFIGPTKASKAAAVVGPARAATARRRAGERPRGFSSAGEGLGKFRQ